MPTIYKNGHYYGKGSSVTVDADLSTTSTNPVQNKTITGAIGSLTQLDTTEKTNLVGAVNETLGKGGTRISQAEFDALSQAEKDNGTAWYIYDGEFENKFMAHTGFTPVGTVISVMGKTAPNHYLTCEGQTVQISAYPELANYFEQQFGTKNYFGGDGTTTFGIPDLRGEFLRGTGTNSHTDQGSGANVGEHQDATAFSEIAVSSRYVEATNKDNRFGTQTATSGAIGNTGNSNAWFNSRPTNTSVLYCIATKNIYIDVKNQYSTDEMVIGNWIDGKPIYQKTLIDTTALSGTSKDIDISLLSPDFVQIGYCCIVHSASNEFMYTPPTFIDSNNYFSVSLIGNGHITLRYTSNIASNRGNHGYILTIQYTKTTD